MSTPEPPQTPQTFWGVWGGIIAFAAVAVATSAVRCQIEKSSQFGFAQ